MYIVSKRHCGKKSQFVRTDELDVLYLRPKHISSVPLLKKRGTRIGRLKQSFFHG